MEEAVHPICSPAFLDRHGPIESPADLLKLPLIHDDNLLVVPTFPTWQRWFEAAGVYDVKSPGGHRFDFSPMAIDAAIEGRGIALGRSALIADDLESGRLVRIAAFCYPITHYYNIIYPIAAVKARKIIQFRNWLITEARKTSGALSSQELHRHTRTLGPPQVFV
jgi:LysR family glycine cleavage system transcriptional activator